MVTAAQRIKKIAKMKPKITMVDIEELSPSAVQPRSQFDEEKLSELAESIRNLGILQPLIVRKSNQRKLEIVAGERRFRAAERAKIKTLPCIVMDLITEDALAIALVENIQRQDLNPIEEALAYLKLKESLKLSQEDVAIRVGKDRTSVANTMRLLRLPKVVQDMIAAEILSMGHAKALLALDSNDMMVMLAKKTAREGLSVRKVEGLIRSIKSGYIIGDAKNPLQPNETSASPLQREIAQKLEYALGAKVTLRKELNGYAVVIHFADADQLNNLLDNLGIEI